MRVALNVSTGPAARRSPRHPARLLAVAGAGLTLAGALSDNGEPYDISAADVSVKVAIRRVGAQFLTAMVACDKLPGLEAINGFVSMAAPFDVPGRGGRFVARVQASAFPSAGEYEAEVGLVLGGADADAVVGYDVVRIHARESCFSYPPAPPATDVPVGALLFDGGALLLGDAYLLFTTHSASTGALFLGEEQVLLDDAEVLVS